MQDITFAGHTTRVLTSKSTWKPADSAQAFCTCGWRGVNQDGFNRADNVNRAITDATIHDLRVRSLGARS